MVFSSIEFLFFFLPLCLAAHLLCPPRGRNLVLLVASFCFYLWGAGALASLLVGSIVANFSIGLAIDAARRRGRPRLLKAAVAVGVGANLALLVVFKYANLALAELDRALGAIGVSPLSWSPLVLPLGISFLTFHGISYVVDVGRGRTPALRDPVRFALYLALFPQLVAGPIVRYHEIADQLSHRQVTRPDLSAGIVRFVHGLAKKVVVADTVAAVADNAFALDGGQRSMAAAWVGLLAYTVQIYFDFSGYSDMAVGLARMFGFRFPENFARPYSALSVTDFWRRWHRSLSSWFRDYLYVPLGGNRVTPARLTRNLVVVFAATGMWHGASWTFLLWGLLHGGALLVERHRGHRHLEVPPTLQGVHRHRWVLQQRVWTLAVVAMGWVLFRSVDLASAGSYYRALFDPTRSVPTDLVALGLHRKAATVLLAACAVFLLPRGGGFGAHLELGVGRWLDGWRLALVGAALPYCVVLIASGTFSPFLYFQF